MSEFLVRPDFEVEAMRKYGKTFAPKYIPFIW